MAISSVKALAGRISEQKKDGLATLVIDHSVEDDAGSYSCVTIVKQTEITNATIRAVCKYDVFSLLVSSHFAVRKFFFSWVL